MPSYGILYESVAKGKANEIREIPPSFRYGNKRLALVAFKLEWEEYAFAEIDFAFILINLSRRHTFPLSTAFFVPNLGEK